MHSTGQRGHFPPVESRLIRVNVAGNDVCVRIHQPYRLQSDSYIIYEYYSVQEGICVSFTPNLVVRTSRESRELGVFGLKHLRVLCIQLSIRVDYYTIIGAIDRGMVTLDGREGRLSLLEFGTFRALGSRMDAIVVSELYKLVLHGCTRWGGTRWSLPHVCRWLTTTGYLCCRRDILV